jgi:hypothetical protein
MGDRSRVLVSWMKLYPPNQTNHVLQRVLGATQAHEVDLRKVEAVLRVRC